MYKFSVTAFLKRCVTVLLGLLVASSAATLSAQVMVSPAFETTQPATATDDPSTTKTMTLHAAGEPDPAFRYRLWPAPEDRRQGNPMPFVSRAILLSIGASQSPDGRSDFADRYNAFTEMSIDELPAEEVRAFLNKYGQSALAELKRAENLMGLDYDLRMNELSASQLVSTLLPEYQEMRGLARLLSLRARLAAAEGRWDDMVDDLRLGFRLAEFAGHGNDFLIARLVGYAINGLMSNVVEQAIQLPGCPNLYWAIASLPEDRLFEIRDSIEFESALLTRLFRNIGPLPDTTIGAAASREKLQKFIQEATQTMSSLGNESDVHASAQMVAGLYVVTMAESSRKLLDETEMWRGKAKNLSAAEAVLRAMQLRFLRLRDNWTKWAMLPDALWDNYKQNTNLELKNLNRADVLESLIYQVTPAVDAARNAARRTRLAKHVLLTIEAIRMHAAVSGELPQSLQDLQPVPAWPDNLTHQSIQYTRVSSKQATLLRSPRWSGDRETTIEFSLSE